MAPAFKCQNTFSCVLCKLLSFPVCRIRTLSPSTSSLSMSLQNSPRTNRPMCSHAIIIVNTRCIFNHVAVAVILFFFSFFLSFSSSSPLLSFVCVRSCFCLVKIIYAWSFSCCGSKSTIKIFVIIIMYSLLGCALCWMGKGDTVRTTLAHRNSIHINTYIYSEWESAFVHDFEQKKTKNVRHAHIGSPRATSRHQTGKSFSGCTERVLCECVIRDVVSFPMRFVTFSHSTFMLHFYASPFLNLCTAYTVHAVACGATDGCNKFLK